MVDQITHLADEMLAACVSSLTRGFDDFARFLGHFRTNLGDAVGQQLAGIRILAWIGRAVGDRFFEFVEWSIRSRHVISGDFPVYSGTATMTYASLNTLALSRKRVDIVRHD